MNFCKYLSSVNSLLNSCRFIKINTLSIVNVSYSFPWQFAFIFSVLRDFKRNNAKMARRQVESKRDGVRYPCNNCRMLHLLPVFWKGIWRVYRVSKKRGIRVNRLVWNRILKIETIFKIYLQYFRFKKPYLRLVDLNKLYRLQKFPTGVSKFGSNKDNLHLHIRVYADLFVIGFSNLKPFLISTHNVWFNELN